MSWLKYHKVSEQLASQAQIALGEGKKQEAMRLYACAAEAENAALNSLDVSKTRTLGISAVSAASLYFKAGDFVLAGQMARQWLGHASLPPFAVDQLQDLLQSILSEQAGFAPGQVLMPAPPGQDPTGEGKKRGRPPAPADARMADARDASFAKVDWFLDASFAKVSWFLNSNMVLPAVHGLLDRRKFADASPKAQLGILLIYQKFGWIDQAESLISNLGRQPPSWSKKLRARLRLVELKLASQRGDFRWVIEHHDSVDQALSQADLPEQRISAFHRLGVAFAVERDSENSETAFDRALRLSRKYEQVHAKSTGKMLRALARAFRTRPAERGQCDLTRDVIKTLRKAQLQYLWAPMEWLLDQVNERKSFVACLFAEAAVLLRCTDARPAGWYVLGLAHLLGPSAATRATAEGYAELLGLVDEGWLMNLVNNALSPEGEAEDGFLVEFHRESSVNLLALQADIAQIDPLDINSWEAFRPDFNIRLSGLGAP